MPPERRSSGLLRVPFVRRCRLEFPARTEGERALVGFTVNLNILGAYVAAEAGQFPALGEAVVCHVNTPDNGIEMPIVGVIAWVNAHQPHPVHSLPPGFGIKFENLAEEHKQRILDVVDEYLKRHPQHAR
jgi:Tfp pilus assembly protein PilZ